MDKEKQKIRLVVNQGTEKEEKYEFDKRILNFKLELLEGNHDQVYPIPPAHINRLFPLEFMQKFAECHQYDPSKFTINKPLKTNDYEKIVNKEAYECCKKYTNLDFIQEAQQIITLANYLNFSFLEEAIMAAVGVNYYVGDNERDIEQFSKKVKMDLISPQQITEIMNQYEDVFVYIENKYKEEMLNE